MIKAPIFGAFLIAQQGASDRSNIVVEYAGQVIDRSATRFVVEHFANEAASFPHGATMLGHAGAGANVMQERFFDRVRCRVVVVLKGALGFV